MGAAAQQWKSKMRWDLANEIDIRAFTGETETLPAVDRELQSRLKEALMTRYVENMTSGAAGMGEDD